MRAVVVASAAAVEKSSNGGQWRNTPRHSMKIAYHTCSMAVPAIEHHTQWQAIPRQ
jgi:hypothetical protein